MMSLVARAPWRENVPTVMALPSLSRLEPSVALGSVLQKGRFLADGLSEDLAHGLAKKTSSNTSEFGKL